MKAKVYFEGNLISEIEYKSHQFSNHGRFNRSLKTFLTFFGVATVSVLIPVLHFF